jgi:hypothetical protein
MEVHFKPDLEKKLNDLAALSGLPPDELVQEAVAGYFEELAQAREMLDRRYDDMKSGRVKLISGDDVFERLRKKSEARKLKSGS